MNLKNHLNNNNINEEAIEEVFIEVIVIFNGSKEDLIKKIKDIGGTFLDLHQGFGIITIKLKDLVELKNIETIEKIEPPNNLFFRSFNEESIIVDYEDPFNEMQSSFENNKYSLTGSGVLIGFVDSGINFTHPAFKDFNNKTRIKYIYNINENKIYDENDINNALDEKKPFEFLNEKDLRGHGTSIASVAAAGGVVSKKYYGVASECNLIMAKLGSEEIFKNSWEIQVLKGISFLIEKAFNLKMPLVINLSINNDNANFLEEYLNRISSLENVTIVVSVGNSGDREKHFSDKLSVINKISWNVSVGEQKILMTLAKKRIDNFDIKIELPNGEFIEFKSDIQYGYFFVKNNKVEIYKELNQFNESLEVVKIFISNDTGYIASGTWTMVFNNKNIFGNLFDLWLPISRGGSRGTVFFNATRENTILAPALSSGVISVGSCNPSGELSVFSAIGSLENEEEIKPNIIAVGEQVLSVSKDWFAYISGTSIATAKVSGIVALLMEWGLVRGYDRELYGRKLKYYIQLSAIRNKSINYPNNEYGYGIIFFNEIIKLLEAD